MSYYMGDYYARGDYYPRGDPGLFSWLGKISKAAVGLLPGGGAVTGAIEAITPAARAGGLMGRVSGAAGTLGRIVKGHPVLSGAGAAGVAGLMLGAGAEGLMMPGMAGGALRGYHMSKPHRRYGVYPRPPHLVKNRRMRVTNTRALRRSLRRVGGFARIAKRVLSFTHPRSARGRVRYRFPKRRKTA